MVGTPTTMTTEEHMDALWIITVFNFVDEVMLTLGHRSHALADVPDSEVITIAIVAAKYFQNHHERTVCVMQELGYLSGTLSVSRFNRRVHRLADWLPFLVESLADVWLTGDVFIIDSLPIPTCRRARARRCRKVNGRAFCGYCAAKKEKFFGWRLHLVCTPNGVPIRFTVLPAAWHDLTPIYELSLDLPQTAGLFGDKGYVSAPDAARIAVDGGVRLVAKPRKNMQPLEWADEYDLRDTGQSDRSRWQSLQTPATPRNASICHTWRPNDEPRPAF